ncbi:MULTISPECIES: metalloregulator ArsR/SmtB family transcription factor [Mycobacteriaceae]|uniref:helix-turn-helix transcriptional regulator n=1 Tax=Mycobacteriaceae TaxID=1762 RepID=UPI0007FE1CCA|nr:MULTISPECIES: helix-turn-helix domain-containing protein [Mycobacteriaceae]MCK0174935.1 ArsR family transcriptional regulator [Mycolicibacterium sp. F2034L]OBB61415.1 ArsR family transcriptional regulator [Mycobacterium sp. 852013-51886_SCH5428379]
MSVRGHDAERTADRAAGRQRQNVLSLLRDANRPVDAQGVADALQIHITTARFHLSALESQGYVRRGSTRPTGAGRPKLTYELAPRLDYADIVSLFATHLGGTPQERELRARRIGADLAHRVRLARRRDESTISDLVVATLTELGFQVRSVLSSFGEVTVQLCTCPLAEVAKTAPEVVRGIQQGLIQEVIDLNAGSIGGSYTVAVTPDPHAGSCEVGLVLRPARG